MGKEGLREEWARVHATMSILISKSKGVADETLLSWWAKKVILAFLYRCHIGTRATYKSCDHSRFIAPYILAGNFEFLLSVLRSFAHLLCLMILLEGITKGMTS